MYNIIGLLLPEGVDKGAKMDYISHSCITGIATNYVPPDGRAESWLGLMQRERERKKKKDFISV